MSITNISGITSATSVNQIYKEKKKYCTSFLLLFLLGLQRLQQLFDAIAQDEYVVKVNMVRVAGVEDAYDTIIGLDSKVEGDKRLILDLPTKDCETIMINQV